MMSRIWHWFGIHTMRTCIDDGDTVIAKCRWCDATTVGVSAKYG